MNPSDQKRENHKDWPQRLEGLKNEYEVYAFDLPFYPIKR